jgi:hypothetical protein
MSALALVNQYHNFVTTFFSRERIHDEYVAGASLDQETGRDMSLITVPNREGAGYSRDSHQADRSDRLVESFLIMLKG